MKKTLLILGAVASFSVHAQLIQNSNFESLEVSETSVTPDCNSGEGFLPADDANDNVKSRVKVAQADGIWYRCGAAYIELDPDFTSEGKVLVSPTQKTPSLRQTITVENTSGDALKPGTSYTVTARVRFRGLSADKNTNPIIFTFRQINDLSKTHSGVALIGDQTGMSKDANQILVAHDAFNSTDYTTFTFSFTTPNPLPIGTDAGENGSGNHQGVVLQLSRGKYGSDNDHDDANDLFIAELSMTEDAAASIDDLLVYGFNAYPNPANDVLKVSAAENIQSVALYSLTGQLVKSVVVDAKSATIDVANLTSGVYVAKASVAGVQGTFKVVKN